MSIEVTLADEKFLTKDAARTRLRAILNSAALGSQILGTDLAVVKAALQRHPEAAEKVGSGLAAIEVRSAQFGTRCFWAVDTRGEARKFSLASCV